MSYFVTSSPNEDAAKYDTLSCSNPIYTMKCLAKECISWRKRFFIECMPLFILSQRFFIECMPLFIPSKKFLYLACPCLFSAKSLYRMHALVYSQPKVSIECMPLFILSQKFFIECMPLFIPSQNFSDVWQIARN